MGYAIRKCSAICLEAPPSQFGEGARPHLYMDEWNRPTPVRKHWSLTRAVRESSFNFNRPDIAHEYEITKYILTVLRVLSVIRPLKSADALSGKILFYRFCAAGTNGCLDLSLSRRASEDLLQDYTRYGQGPGIYDNPRRVSLLVGVGRRHPVNMRKASFRTLSMKRM